MMTMMTMMLFSSCVTSHGAVSHMTEEREPIQSVRPRAKTLEPRQRFSGSEARLREPSQTTGGSGNECRPTDERVLRPTVCQSVPLSVCLACPTAGDSGG